MARYPLDGNPKKTSYHGEPTNMGSFGKHLGIDRSVVNVPFYAPSDGVINHVGFSANLGNNIEAEFLGHTWRFAHASRIDVRVGQSVKEGQQLGVTGNTGVTTGPHLHYDARRLGTAWNASFNNYVDPDKLIESSNAPKSEYIFLKPHVSRWRFYKLGVAPRAGNESAFLNPKKFGGLEYKILGYEDGGKTAVIQTEMFGKGKVFIDGDAEIRRR